MVNIDTHKIVDMIEARDLESVKRWLASYPNISIVSRDGSITYKNAITQSHPNAIQVSDRFHILKNLTNYCKDFLKKYLKNRVIVDEIISDVTDKTVESHKSHTLQEKYELTTAEILSGAKKSTACKKYHLDIRVYNKLNALTESGRFNYYATKKELKQNSTEANKMKFVTEVRETYNETGSMRKTAKLHDMSRNTVKKYLEDSFSPVHARKGVKEKSILDPYKSLINNYVVQGATSKIIIETIRLEGYTGSNETVRRYLIDKKKENSNTQSQSNAVKYEYIERKTLVKLLFRDVDKVKGLTEEIVNKVYLENPLFKKIIELVSSFRCLMRHKKVQELERWIEIDYFVLMASPIRN